MFSPRPSRPVRLPNGGEMPSLSPGANKNSKLARRLATTEPCKRLLALKERERRGVSYRAASRLTDSQGRNRRGKIRGVSWLRVLTHHTSPIIIQEKARYKPQVALSSSTSVQVVFAVAVLSYSRRLPSVFWKESRRSCPPPQVPAAIL